MKVICVKREAEYFLRWGWTAQIRLIRFNKSDFSNIAEQRREAEKNGESGMIFAASRRSAGRPIRNRALP
jgi:hypothetical protein